MTGDNDAAGPSYQAALALHMQGRAGEAEQAYRAVLESHPDHAEALHGLGVLHLQNRRADLAVDFLRRAVVASGGSPVIRNNLGVALCAAGRFAGAAEVYREAVRAEPDSVPPLLNLGKILNVLGAWPEAVAVLRHAVALAPADAQVHQQLGMALSETGHGDEALGHFEKAVALAPDRSDVHCDLGAMLLKLKRPQQAAESYRRALTITPRSPAALCGLGETMGVLSQHDEAVSCFDRAIALAPDFALAHFNRGTALTYLGRKQDAAKAFVRAAELDPGSMAFRRALLGLEKVSTGNEHLKALEALAAGRRDPAENIALHFALAKAYDDIGDHSRAMTEWRQGNAAKRSLSRYDIENDLARFRAIAATFTAGFLSAQAASGETSDVPVFVIGMPRSGTTLVEQILASHPDVFGAGEQVILPDFINSGRAGRDFPASVGALGREEWRALGADYVERLRALAPQAARITDKLPLNFQLVGLIRIALPHARVVHVMRNPLDTCFSCYSVLLDDDLDFSCDLADLGRYYRGYRGLMDHWRTVLPPDAMLEIRYESLVADIETQARRLVDYCGLPWDARCLAFHETDRPVETASVLQVRRPLYDTSVGRAARYAAWLEPLRHALGDALEQ
jgi:tetratricopeptide (TPR) repeat protein